MASTSESVTFSRGLVRTALGTVHYTKCGGGSGADLTPCLAFHMSPRSSDEYREAMPHLSGDGGRTVVAIDELGYGESDSPSRSCELDEIADCALSVADELGIGDFVAVGSLLGCCLVLSLASRYPDRVKAVVLTNPYHYPAKGGDETKPSSGEEEAKGDRPKPIPDPWILKDDGSHVTDLWSRRSGWLDPDLNTRAVRDELVYLLKRRERYERGVNIQDVSKYNFEGAARGTKCPTLLLSGVGATGLFDAIGLDMSGQFAKAMEFFADKEVADPIEPGSINLINQDAEAWAHLVNEYLSARSL